MQRCLILSIVFSLLIGLPAIGADEADDDQAQPPAALNFEMVTIDGQPRKLSDYQGKVVVMVNVASRCGFTPQYADLQDLHENYAERGLVILGFPCNQFGNQEPGSEAEIKEFCSENYGVEFEMFSKVDVNGDDRAPLYGHLTSLEAPPAGSGDIRWNFEKFVIDRQGNVIGRFGSRTKPTGDEFVALIEQALSDE